MAEYIAAAQTVAANGNVLFAGGRNTCNIKHRDGTGVFTLKGSGNCCNPARYRVDAHILATATGAGAIQAVLTEDGEALPETEIGLQAAAAGNVLSGHTATEVVVECACAKLALRGITAIPLTSASIIITRIA